MLKYIICTLSLCLVILSSYLFLLPAHKTEEINDILPLVQY